MTTITTDDGYTFTLQPDGSWSDGDLVFPAGTIPGSEEPARKRYPIHTGGSGLPPGRNPDRRPASAKQLSTLRREDEDLYQHVVGLMALSHTHSRAVQQAAHRLWDALAREIES